VFRENRRKVATESKVLANKHADSNRAAEPEGLVMAIAQADGKAASIKAGFKIEYSEHSHSILRHCEFFANHTDMPEAQAFNERLHNVMVWDRLVGSGCGRRGNACQFFSRKFSVVGNQRGIFGHRNPPVICEKTGSAVTKPVVMGHRFRRLGTRFPQLRIEGKPS
jgi:hypothetical protein